MDKNSAILLLEKTFKNKFKMENYVIFLKELFNKSNIHPRVYDKIRKEYWNYENEVYILGDYEDDDGNSIALYAIELSKESYRDRARTMQRNLVASLIKDHYDSALVAFYEPNLKDWRFSHVKVEYEFNEKGIKEKLSSPRRHSFLVGVNEPNHTCQRQFLDLIQDEDNIKITDIEQAFNIENVTDEFFNEYKRLFLDLTDSLDDVKKSDLTVKKEFEDKNIKSSDFAKKLMGQLVFIYFLQKKGWLGVEENSNWGSGPRNFLRKIFNKSVENSENFFNEVLEPLFYKGLSEEVVDYHYSEFGYKVPFLNGGLFEPINNYNWIKTDVTLENKIFAEIFDTFDKFNFTVKEDEPLEKEVAVDPEMLGKVFENLLEVTDRKSKGAFYTPRYIVHYICKENLISYLAANSDVSEEDMRTFIINGDLAINSIIRANEEKKKYNGRSYTKIELPDSIKENSDNLENLLKKVKVIDPAVGSGAFPVGMMNEIVKARYILRLLNEIEDVNMYDLKRETIENSLYGVDIDYSATDVTKLRFWLSLVVDEEDIKQIKPLPNLDNQIMCGNSVVDGYNDIRLFDDNLIVRSEQTRLSMTPTERAFEEIEKKKREYFDVNGPLRKEELKNEIKELKWKFIETYLKDIGQGQLIDEIKKYEHADAKPFFIWELEFSEVFKGKNPGFDIVVANPPYVKADLQDEEFQKQRRYMVNSGQYETLYERWDLFIAFIEKGLKLLKKDAQLGFIISSSYNTSKSSKKSKEYILNNYYLKKIDLFKDVEVFKGVGVENLILFVQNKKSDKLTTRILHTNSFENSKILKPTKNINQLFRFDEYVDLEKNFNETVLLGDICYINYGLRPNADEKKAKGEFKKADLISNTKNKINCREYVEGKNLKPYKIEDIRYLEWNTNRVPKKIARPTFPELYEFPKIIRGTTTGAIFDDNKLLCNHSCSVIVQYHYLHNVKNRSVNNSIKKWTNKSRDELELNSKKFDINYILAILNSNLAVSYLNSIKKARIKNYFYPDELKILPIKLISLEKQKELSKLAISISNSNKELYNEINSFKKWVKTTLGINKLSKKLEDYYFLDSEEFLKEIKKKKTNINIQITQDLLAKKFNESLETIALLQKEIKKTENTINQLVYKLYNLNENEIKIIENSLK